MEQSTFLRGLLQEADESLSDQITLWDDSTIWTAVWTSLKEKTSIDHPLVDQVDGLVKANSNWDALLWKSDQDFKLMKLCRLAELSDVTLPASRSAIELNDLCLKIEQFALQCLRETDEKFEGTTTPELVQYTLEKMFAEFTARFVEASDSEKEEAADKILKEIKELDEEDRHRLMDELGLDDLTSSALTKLMAAGSFATGLSTVVAVAGFAAYTNLMIGISAAAGLFGVTLPFAVYMNAAAGLAFMTNPVVLVVGALGLGGWLTHQSNSTIRKRLLPVPITYSVLSHDPSSHSPGSADRLADTVADRHRDIPKETGTHQKLLKQAFPNLPPRIDVSAESKKLLSIGWDRLRSSETVKKTLQVLRRR